MGIILFSLFIVCLMVSPPFALGRYKEGKICASASISFVGYEETETGYKFSYEVRSGIGRDRIRFWVLESDAFRLYQVSSASEKFIQINGVLRFPKSYRNTEDREVEFTLGKEYSPPAIGYINYLLKLQWFCPGIIKGPSMPRL